MYREKRFCQTFVPVPGKEGKQERCGVEVGYALISHDDDAVLAQATRSCPRCGANGINEAAYLWDLQPSMSTYAGPTVHMMALGRLDVLRRERNAAA